jgi:hypothetical protein
MSTLQITQVGYTAMVDAEAFGYRLSVTTVKFGTGTGYVPSKEDKDIHGDLLYSGPISNCDVITDEIIDFLCICESNYTTSVYIGEIGLYLDTGELFALGCYPYPFSKSPDSRFKTHALCISPYLASTIDMTLSWSMSLPRVNHYGDLPNPERTGDNAYVINNGFSYETLRPSMVTRYALSSSGPMAWALLNGSLYYKGKVVAVGTEGTQFTLLNPPISNIPPDILDFAFIYVYNGTGRTQCRAVSYSSEGGGVFNILHENFTSIEAGSVSPASSDACETFSGTPTTINVVSLDSTSEVVIWTAARLLEGAGAIYQSRWDASTGYPSNPAPLRGMYWVINNPGIINGVVYQINDWLVYHGSGIWDKLDNTELPYLLYRGTWSAASGSAPPTLPVTYFWENVRQGHYWIISVAGTIAGKAYDVGDWIVWTGTDWDQRFRDHVLTALRWRNPRTITLTGGSVTGNVTLDGSADVNLPVVVNKWTTPRTLSLLGNDVGGEVTFDGSGDIGLDVTVKKWNVARRIAFKGIGDDLGNVSGSFLLDGTQDIEVDLTVLHTATADRWATPRTITVTGTDVLGGIPLLDGTQNVDLNLTVLDSRHSDRADTADKWYSPITLEVEGYTDYAVPKNTTSLSGSVTFNGTEDKVMTINITNVPHATYADTAGLAEEAEKCSGDSDTVDGYHAGEIFSMIPRFSLTATPYIDGGGDNVGTSMQIGLPPAFVNGPSATWYFPVATDSSGVCHTNCFGAGRHCGKW